MSHTQAVYRSSSYADPDDPSREGRTNPFTTPHRSNPSISLEDLSSRPNPLEPEVDLTAPENATSLSPADAGKAAWLFLTGATAIEVLIWGIPFSIGVLHAYWTEELFPGRGTGTITLAATLQTGLSYMVAALSGP